MSGEQKTSETTHVNDEEQGADNMSSDENSQIPEVMDEVLDQKVENCEIEEDEEIVQEPPIIRSQVRPGLRNIRQPASSHRDRY